MKKRAAGAAGVVLSTAALLLGTVAAVPASAASTSGRTLIIDNSFVLVTADPGHVYEQTGNLIDNAMYDTLVTYSGTSLKTLVPQLATSYQTLDGGKKFIFHLNPAAKFSDGSPVTSADVAWSLTRMINLKGNPAFLLAGETITTDGPEAVSMTSSIPNPGLPYILADPACGILNMAVVEAHGGTDAANAATKDTAENWLNDNSAGSGPYVMKSFSTTSQVVLDANPNYWGHKPAWSTIVLRNTSTSAIERLDVQRGTNEIAIDLDPSQTAGMTNVQIHEGAGPTYCSSSPTTTPRSRRSPRTTTSRKHSATGSTTPACSSSQAPGQSRRRASSRPCSSGRCRRRPTPSTTFRRRSRGWPSLGSGTRRSSSLTRLVSRLTGFLSTTPPLVWSNTLTRSGSTSRSSRNPYRSAWLLTAPGPSPSGSGSGARLRRPRRLPGLRPRSSGWAPCRVARVRQCGGWARGHGHR